MRAVHKLEVLLVHVSVLPLMVAQSTTSFFVVPPDLGANLLFATNDVYTIGDQLDVKWVTDKDTYSIVLWQQSLTQSNALTGQAVYSKLAGSSETGTFSWTVDAQTFDIEQSNVFFFAAGPITNTIDENSFTSHYFNLSDTASSQSTSASASLPTKTAALSTSQLTGTSSVISTTSSTTQASPTATPAPGLDKTSKVGLGVGVGLGLPLLLVILYLIVSKVRKVRKKKQLRGPDANPYGCPPPPFEKPPKYASEMSTTRSSTLPPLSHSSRSYVSDQNREEYPVELPAQQYRR